MVERCSLRMLLLTIKEVYHKAIHDLLIAMGDAFLVYAKVDGKISLFVVDKVYSVMKWLQIGTSWILLRSSVS